MGEMPWPHLIAAVAAFYVGHTVVGLVLGAVVERVAAARRVYAVPKTPGQHRLEVQGNLTFLLVAIAATSWLLRAQLVRWGDDDAVAVAATFAVFFVAFQAHFYVMHRALHTRALVRFHRHHHKSQVTSPWSGQSMGVVEAIGWMGGYLGIPLLMSLVHPVSWWGVVAYLSYNIVGNIVGHAGVEVVPPSSTLRWRSLLATVFTYHALHHARWTGHYGYACTWTDRLLKTEWPDWMLLHQQVWNGQPMASLKERQDVAVLTPPSGS